MFIGVDEFIGIDTDELWRKDGCIVEHRPWYKEVGTNEKQITIRDVGIGNYVF